MMPLDRIGASGKRSRASGFALVPSPTVNSAFPTLIVADDLTGACDAAVAFAPRGLPARVTIDDRLEALGRTAVSAISTGSRQQSSQDAEFRLTSVARLAKGFPRIFKKIDSAWRGNTAREIALSIRLFPAGLAILAPAYPALDRTAKDGVIRIADLYGERTIDALGSLRAAGCPFALIPAGLPEASMAEQMKAAHSAPALFFCDALEQTHLEAVVRAARGLSQRVLWIGSGGLAHALAAAEPMRPEESIARSRGLVLLFCGSDHPISAAQVDYLSSVPGVVLWSPGKPAPANLSEAAAVLIPVTCGTTRKSDIAALAEQLRFSSIGCLFMTGGDTAALVCRALAIEALDLQREVQPGMPQGIACGGSFSGSTVILKSGGFGEAATIGKIVEQFGSLRGGSR